MEGEIDGFIPIDANATINEDLHNFDLKNNAYGFSYLVNC
jgi:hypothetical protein